MWPERILGAVELRPTIRPILPVIYVASMALACISPEQIKAYQSQAVSTPVEQGFDVQQQLARDIASAINSPIPKFTDLDKIPVGSEDEFEQRLLEFQRILKGMINTDVSELGSIRANQYGQMLDSIPSNTEGFITEKDKESRYQLDQGVNLDVYDDIYWLQINLNKQGLLDRWSNAPIDYIMTIEDALEFSRMFKVPPGWMREEKDEYFGTDRMGKRVVEAVGRRFFYPDGSQVDVFATAQGNFSFTVPAF